MHWHRNNGAARLFGGEQNAQGAGEEASSWRDKSVGGLGRSGLGGSAIAEDADHEGLESCLPACFGFVLVLLYYVVLCCAVLTSLAWSYEMITTAAVEFSVEIAIPYNTRWTQPHNTN